MTSASAKFPAQPTARHHCADTHETPFNQLPAGVGPRSRDHDLPFHDSTNGMLVSLSLPYVPTALHAVADAHATSDKRAAAGGRKLLIDHTAVAAGFDAAPGDADAAPTPVAARNALRHTIERASPWLPARRTCARSVPIGPPGLP